MPNIILNLLLDCFFIFFPVIFISYEIKKPNLGKILEKLGIKKSSPALFAKQTILLFAALIVISFIVSIVLYTIGIRDTQGVFETIDAIKTAGIFYLFYFLLVRVTTEEIFFRGFLQGKIGILLSTALFALGHVLYGSVAEVIGAFILGLVLAKAFEKNKNLVPNIFAHIFYNFFMIILAYAV